MQAFWRRENHRNISLPRPTSAYLTQIIRTQSVIDFGPPDQYNQKAHVADMFTIFLITPTSLHQPRTLPYKRSNSFLSLTLNFMERRLRRASLSLSLSLLH